MIMYSEGYTTIRFSNLVSQEPVVASETPFLAQGLSRMTPGPQAYIAHAVGFGAKGIVRMRARSYTLALVASASVSGP